MRFLLLFFAAVGLLVADASASCHGTKVAVRRSWYVAPPTAQVVVAAPDPQVQAVTTYRARTVLEPMTSYQVVQPAATSVRVRAGLFGRGVFVSAPGTFVGVGSNVFWPQPPFTPTPGTEKPPAPELPPAPADVTPVPAGPPTAAEAAPAPGPADAYLLTEDALFARGGFLHRLRRRHKVKVVAPGGTTTSVLIQ